MSRYVSVLFLMMIAVMYFLPALRARKNGCRNACWRKLLLRNGLLGWTGVFWWQVWREARWSSPMLFAGKPVPYYVTGDKPSRSRLRRIAFSVGGALLVMALVWMGH